MKPFFITLSFSFLLLFNNCLIGQDVFINKKGLEKLAAALKAQRAQAQVRIADYLSKHEILEDDLAAAGLKIVDVINNQPQYIGLHNRDAAEAIGVPAVRDGGSLGINLEGDDIEIGLWDGGIVRTTHQELVGKISYFDGASGSSFSNHSTQVAGMMVAEGIDDRAKGMAPNAQLIAYDFNNDDQEMITAQMQRQLVLSNHSYGTIAGWDGGVWLGDQSISDQEDWRFGFYTSGAAAWDNIALNAPYYLIIKSSGNDRGDSGSGFPPDGPFDLIAGQGTAKNIMLVGAIRKSASGYDDPANITMSSFSNYGPTDDGRIKPDITAVGVDVFSPSADDDDTYASTQGTSFSSPSVCSGLALLQQLHRDQFNTFMKSATLKALAIHSAQEAGSADGPDYRFGWGLLDVEEGSRLLLDLDGESVQIIEDTLFNGGEYEVPLTPKANTQIKATIVWTDPAGRPVPSSLDPTDLMLVNDLDIRILDETGSETMPWILDPTNTALPASTGDNFRDNVEQVILSNTEPRNYTLRVTHKGSTLDGDHQPFSIILEYESENNPQTNLYWIGDTGNWSDGQRWSLASGGTSASLTPTLGNKVIIDDNSVQASGDTLKINSDFSVGSIFSFTDKTYVLDLQGNTLTSMGNVSLSAPNLKIINGSIKLNGIAGKSYVINLDQSTTDNLDMEVVQSNASSWTVSNASFSLDKLAIKGGTVTIANNDLSIGELNIGSDNTNIVAVDLSGSTINDLSVLSIKTGVHYSDNASTSFTTSNSSTIDFGDAVYTGTFNLNGTITAMSSNAQINSAIVNAAQLTLVENLTINDINIMPGSGVIISDGVSLAIEGALEIDATSVGRVSFSSPGAGILNLIDHEKYCFDFLDISNITLSGASVVAIGTNSTLSNSPNWSNESCNDLVFANFSSQFLCAKAQSEFTNESSGDFTSSEWFVDGVSFSNEQNALFTFESDGKYEIKLELADAIGNMTSWTEQVMVDSTSLDSNYIIDNGTQLISFRPGDAYQWYQNGMAIPGATDRTYVYSSIEGAYYVLTFSGSCNRKSTTFQFSTSIENLDDPQVGNEISLQIAPIPTSGELYLTNFNDKTLNLSGKIVNYLGQEVMSIGRTALVSASTTSIDLSGLKTGIYFLVLKNSDRYYSKKIVVK